MINERSGWYFDKPINEDTSMSALKMEVQVKVYLQESA